MARYQKYDLLKESGQRWLGLIPQHWNTSYSKWLFKERNAKAEISDEMLTASQKYGVIPQKLFMELEQQKVVQVQTGHDILKQVKNNDFVISMRSFQGGIEYCGYSGAISSAYVPLEPQESISLGYYKYLFKSKQYIQALQSTTNLVRDGQALRYSNFLQVRLPVLPVDEANKIAAFLDYETARIDQLIAKQQRLIELLKEKRQAVISHAVTKGLNPNAPMKDSGVEWLGQVPEHWVTPKLKWNCLTVSGGTPTTAKYEDYYENGEHPWVRTTDLNNSELLETPIHITQQAIDDTACSLLPIGSVLVAMYGGAGSIGKHSLLRFSAAINQAVCGILPSDKLEPPFLHLYIEFYRPYWMVGAEGTRKDPNIGQDHVRDLILVCPPLSEQKAIVEYVDKYRTQHERLEDKANKAIELMQERRTALISAAVTGKIDLRGWNPPNERNSV